MNWQKISKAKPPVGEPVFIFVPNDSLPFQIDTYNENGDWGDSFNGFRDDNDLPTHWMQITYPVD